MAKTSWIGTRAVWTPVTIDGAHNGKGALFIFRSQRLPWYNGKKLLAVVFDQRLLLFKNDQLLTSLSSDDALINIIPSELTLNILAEFFDWPDVQAVHDGLMLTDLVLTYEPQRWLMDGILQRFHKCPLPGWWPVHRGALGVSFLRNIMDGKNCAEITTTALNLYRGSIDENESLREQRIFKRFNMHEMEANVLHDIMPDPEDVVQVRYMMRQYRLWAYEYCLNNDLPF